MSVKLLTEHHFESLSLKGGCTKSCQNAALLEITCHGSYGNILLVLCQKCGYKELFVSDIESNMVSSMLLNLLN